MKAVGFNSEVELVKLFASGDSKAFTEIYNRYYFIVYRHAQRWLAQSQDAEDITADTFIKLWNHKERFNSTGEIAAFLHVTTRNSCYDFLRHIQVKTNKQEDLIKQFEAGNNTEQPVMEIWEGFINRVYSELDKMPKRMKEIFLLSFEEGLKPSEIAEYLKLNVQTVSNQKSTALSILKAALAKNPEYLLLLSVLLYD